MRAIPGIPRARRTIFGFMGPREGKSDYDGRESEEERVWSPQVASPGSVLARFITGSRRRRVVRLFISIQAIILLVTRHPSPNECREPCGLAHGFMQHAINRESVDRSDSDQVRGSRFLKDLEPAIPKGRCQDVNQVMILFPSSCKVCRSRNSPLPSELLSCRLRTPFGLFTPKCRQPE